MQVRQDKSNPASTTETPVNIGLGPLTLVDLKLSTKQQMKRLKRKRKGAAAAEEDSADEEPAGEEPGAAQLHHLWIACAPCVQSCRGATILGACPYKTHGRRLQSSKLVVGRSLP